MHAPFLFVFDMKKLSAIVLVVIGLLLGVAIGVNTNRYFMRQHEKTTAVMVLLQLHLDDLEKSVSTRNCTQADDDLRSLQSFAKEIAVVLPLADQRDAVFHHHEQQLQHVLSMPAVAQCTTGANEIKQIREACDECHREYR